MAVTYVGDGAANHAYSRALTGGWAGEVLALVTEEGLGDLDAWRIATPDSPVPYSPPLEDALLPGADRSPPRSSRGADDAPAPGRLSLRGLPA